MGGDPGVGSLGAKTLIEIVPFCPDDEQRAHGRDQ